MKLLLAATLAGGVASQVPVARVPSIGLASPVTVGRAPVVGGYGIGGAPAFGIGGAPAFGIGGAPAFGGFGGIGGIARSPIPYAVGSSYNPYNSVVGAVAPFGVSAAPVAVTAPITVAAPAVSAPAFSPYASMLRPAFSAPVFSAPVFSAPEPQSDFSDAFEGQSRSYHLSAAKPYLTATAAKYGAFAGRYPADSLLGNLGGNGVSDLVYIDAHRLWAQDAQRRLEAYRGDDAYTRNQLQLVARATDANYRSFLLPAFGSMGLTSDAAQFVKAGLLSTVEEKMNYAEAARAVLEKAYDDGEADAIANAERANNAAQLYFMGSMIGYQGDATGDDWQRMNQLWAMGQSQVAAQAEEDYASAQDDYYASRSADNYKAMQAAMYASQSANYLMMQRALDSRYSVPSAVGSDTANSWLVQTLMSNAEVNMWNVLNGVDTNNGYGGGDNSGLLYNTVFGKNSDGGTEDLFKILMLSGSF